MMSSPLGLIPINDDGMRQVVDALADARKALKELTLQTEKYLAAAKAHHDATMFGDMDTEEIYESLGDANAQAEDIYPKLVGAIEVAHDILGPG